MGELLTLFFDLTHRRQIHRKKNFLKKNFWEKIFFSRFMTSSKADKKCVKLQNQVLNLKNITIWNRRQDCSIAWDQPYRTWSWFYACKNNCTWLKFMIPFQLSREEQRWCPTSLARAEKCWASTFVLSYALLTVARRSVLRFESLPESRRIHVSSNQARFCRTWVVFHHSQNYALPKFRER